MILVSLSTGGELGLPSQPGDLRVVGIVLWQLASTRECFKRSKVKALALLRPGLRDRHGSSLYWSKPFTVSGGVVVGNRLHLSTCSVVQLCPTLCHPMDCSPPGSSVHGIFQARILEWVVILFSKPTDCTRPGVNLMESVDFG